jgi:hypothetical protein
MRWREIHSDFPISQWEHAQSFDTSESCNNERVLNWDRHWKAATALGKEAFEARQAGSLTKWTEDQLHNLIWAESQAFLARCIATDNPRHKALK